MLLRIVTIEKTQKRKLMGRKISQRFAMVKENKGKIWPKQLWKQKVLKIQLRYVESMRLPKSGI